MASYIELLGRVLISGNIKAVTGLRVGAGSSGLSIGGLENPVVRNPLDQQPYIPGSSIKGKMRSLTERFMGFNPNDPDRTQRIGGNVRIHVCRKAEDYESCDVCHIFGLPGEFPHSSPTRLTVRDVFLDPTSLEGARTDFLSTEVKWEASIDRVTSAALPRQMERVPAGAIFKDFEMVYSLYSLDETKKDVEQELNRLKALFQSMQLLEDDYLGGMGTRGSGKVRFEKLNVRFRKGAEVHTVELAKKDDQTGPALSDVIAQQDAIVEKVKELLETR